MDKILHHSVRLPCDAEQAFKLFTSNEHLQLWLTAMADVEPVVGGKYELFWNPEDRENDSTLGCKITAIEPGKFLSFQWRGPVQYKHFMNNADPLTHVVVFFLPCREENSPTPCTEVHLIHSGWKSSAEWEEARRWFEQAWDNAFEELRKQVGGSQR
jgi:uncharacterized protein YndB with AHSA1/START domain